MSYARTRRARFGRQRQRRRRQRRRSIMVIGAAALAGAVLGMGGGTLALWQDTAGFSISTRTGYEYFAAGAPGATKPATNGTVEFTVGPSQAAKLKDDREIAIPMQTESVSQGNKGLRYTLTEPNWGTHLFGAASTVLFRVDSPQECTVDNAPATSEQLTSTPVSADYSDSEEPVVENWCLVARIDTLPDEGEYSSSVTVTARDAAGTSVKATDSWHAQVTSALDPSKVPAHVITFSYETFRPSEEN